MKTHHLRLAFAAALLSLGACSHSVTTSVLNPAAPVSGVVYSLPKTRVDVTITYTVRSSTNQKNGIAEPVSARSASIKKPITVAPVVVGDEKNQFVLSGEGLAKDGRLDASFKFAVGDNQLLTSVSSEVTDKSPEIFQSLVGTTLSLVKGFAVAGGDQVEKDYAARIGEIDKRIVALSVADGKDRLKEMKALMDERATLVAALETYSAANSPIVTETDVPYTTSLDLDALILTGSAEIKAPLKLLNVPADGTLDIKVTLACTDEQKANATAQLFPATPAPAKDGVYYRVPSRAQLKLTKGEISLFDAPVTFAQLGSIHFVEARYKMWARRKTTINFSTATGGLSDYAVESTSSAEAASKALDAATGKVLDVVTDLKKQKDDAAAKVKTDEEKQLADLEQKQKLLEAELGVLKAEKALAKEKTDDSSGTP